MGLFDTFEAFDFDEGVAGLSVTKNGITFNRGVSAKLKKPLFVNLLISKEEKMIAVKVCENTSPKAVIFCKENEEKSTSIRWNSKDLLNTIQEMMEWKLSECDGYRVDGKYIAEENAVLFDFNNAKPI